MVEAMRHAFVDRNFQLGDPDFVKNPLERLLSESYAARNPREDRSGEGLDLQGCAAGHRAARGHGDDALFDRRRSGNAVSVTYTINALFGAKVIAGDTGFFLNDEMDDFTVKPGVANLFGLVQGKTNAIAPGKRPLSSMSPTIVTKDGKTFMVLGSPGGSRIITIVRAR